MGNKKKSIPSFFVPDVDGCDIAKKTGNKMPIDDCEGVPIGKKGTRADDSRPTSIITVAPIEVLRSQNVALRSEIEALERTLAEVQNERDSLKQEVSTLRLQIMKAQLRESSDINKPLTENVERYRTTGLPARRVKRIPSNAIVFKGQKRKLQ